MKVSSLKLFDRYFAYPIAIVLSPFKRRREAPKDVKGILAIKLWAIGESILTLPSLKKLKEKYPNAKISVLCSSNNSSVYENQEFIDELIILNPSSPSSFVQTIFRVRKGKFDVAFDLEPFLNFSALIAYISKAYKIGFDVDSQKRSRLYDGRIKYNDKVHVTKVYSDLLKPLGITFAPKELLSLPFTEREERNVRKMLKKCKISKKDFIVGMHPGSGPSAVYRRWPEERFAELADALASKLDAKIVFTGSPSEGQIVEKIRGLMKSQSFDFSGKFSIRDFFSLVGHFDVFVSNDTGPMHIAAAQGVPTVGLFGPNTPVRFGPFNKRSVSIYKGTKPVINVHLGQIPNECDDDSMKKIKVSEVFNAVKRIR
ncbi:glycosyltransferase family 9 protein [Candidatus Undinarchaeota archaeon]